MYSEIIPVEAQQSADTRKAILDCRQHGRSTVRFLTQNANAAMGMAFASILDDKETFTTLELKINFSWPVWSALTAEAQVAHRGKTLGYASRTYTLKPNSESGGKGK